MYKEAQTGTRLEYKNIEKLDEAFERRKKPYTNMKSNREHE